MRNAQYYVNVIQLTDQPPVFSLRQKMVSSTIIQDGVYKEEKIKQKVAACGTYTLLLNAAAATRSKAMDHRYYRWHDGQQTAKLIQYLVRKYG